MPAFLLVIERERTATADGAEQLQAWLLRGVRAGVIRGELAVGDPRLRVVREGGVTVAVEDGAHSLKPERVVVFEAEDDKSALAWAAGCPGEGALELYGIADGGSALSAMLQP